MKKTICITPADKTIRGWAEALYVLNEFKRVGYTKREVFVTAVIKANPKYNDFKKVQQLYHFWAMRERSRSILKDLEIIIEQLKAE